MKPKGAVQILTPKVSAKSIAPQVAQIITSLGEDLNREGLVRTPERVDKAMKFLTSGYHVDMEELLNDAIYHVQYDEMVIVKDIEFFSLCEHHMLPFFGKAHVGYLARNKVVGLSKMPRIVDAFARRLQIQERLTQQIAQCLLDSLDPLGVGVILEAQHLCMMMRGVEKQHSGTVTSAMLGEFKQKETRDEFLALVRQRS
jgi:GTP cyclohydrolase I